MYSSFKVRFFLDIIFWMFCILLYLQSVYFQFLSPWDGFWNFFLQFIRKENCDKKDKRKNS